MGAADMAESGECYDLDTWGISYHRALEAVLAMDDRSRINVYIPNQTGRWTVQYMLTPEQQKRLLIVPQVEDAHYLVSKFRTDNGPIIENYPFVNEVYTVKVGSAKIAVVYKKRD